jgi:hypothetical protein
MSAWLADVCSSATQSGARSRGIGFVAGSVETLRVYRSPVILPVRLNIALLNGTLEQRMVKAMTYGDTSVWDSGWVYEGKLVL